MWGRLRVLSINTTCWVGNDDDRDDVDIYLRVVSMDTTCNMGNDDDHDDVDIA